MQSSLLSSRFWTSARVHTLVINERVRQASGTDQVAKREYAEFLLRVGDGTEPRVHIPHAVSDLIRIPDHLLSRNLLIEDLVSDVYGDLADENAFDSASVSAETLALSRRAGKAAQFFDKVLKAINHDIQERRSGTAGALTIDIEAVLQHSPWKQILAHN
eukprot:g57949.t1